MPALLTYFHNIVYILNPSSAFSIFFHVRLLCRGTRFVARENLQLGTVC